MNILITGGNGYIATSLRTSLKSNHEITSISRCDFDLSILSNANDWFLDKYFDVVIHTAIKGGSRLTLDDASVLDTNLKMYYNLLHNKSHFGKLINFGSGAELYKKDGYYGLSKHVIRTSLLEQENFYNLRIYGVFDENELDTRFIKSNIIRYINKRPIYIHQNKFMDFIHMKDLVKIVDEYITKDNLSKEIDCVYSKKHSLLDIANLINNLSNYKVHIEINNKTGDDYCGVNNIEDKLEDRIKEVYRILKK
jgi:nucleoside-diphosphate-sugar epimerase